MREYRVLLADDHVLFRESFARVLTTMLPQPASIAQANDWLELRNHAELEQTDLIMVDLCMPGNNDWRIDLSELMAKTKSSVCVISADDRHDHLEAAFQIGVNAYLCKTTNIEELERTLQHVCAGKTYIPAQLMRRSTKLKTKQGMVSITCRERDILQQLAEGFSNKTIAETLGLKESTIKRHVHNIFVKLNAKNRTEAVKIAQQQGIFID